MRVSIALKLSEDEVCDFPLADIAELIVLRGTLGSSCDVSTKKDLS